MATDTQAQRKIDVEVDPQQSDGAAASAAQAGDANAARSKENIARWMSYLPRSCVKLMIAMGWDIST